jgi:transcriptional regulator with XRE-family HTH domain
MDWNPDVLKLFRGEFGLTQALLAALLRDRGMPGASATNLSRWERGQVAPGKSTRSYLSRALTEIRAKVQAALASGERVQDEVIARAVRCARDARRGIKPGPGRPSKSRARVSASGKAPQNPAKALGPYLITLRQARNLKQHQLARRLRKPQSTISAWEDGKQFPGIVNLAQLAEALEIPVKQLLIAAGFKLPSSERFPIVGQVGDGAPSAPILVFSYEGFSLGAGGRPNGSPTGTVPDTGDDRNAYALLVEGSDLSPRVLPGDLLYVVTDRKAEDGQMCLISEKMGTNFWIRGIRLCEGSIEMLPLARSGQVITRPCEAVWIHHVISIRPKRVITSPPVPPHPAMD